jgi:hypothetical protein
MSFVNDKIGAALECGHRPLHEGETPKRPGQTTVYEATGLLDPAFRELLEKGLLEPSWKIDGTCCLIKDGVYYRRYDSKNQAVDLPEGSIPGESDSDGVTRIWWIPVVGSTKKDDERHLSALSPDQKAFWTIAFNPDGSMTPVLKPFDATESATYELIGPKFVAKYRDLPAGEVTLRLEMSGKKNRGKLEDLVVPRHYLVRHGDYVVRDFPFQELLTTPDPIGFFRDFVVSHHVEGLVFRHKTDKKIYFKVNRGHISVPHHKDEILVLNPSA